MRGEERRELQSDCEELKWAGTSEQEQGAAGFNRTVRN